MNKVSLLVIGLSFLQNSFAQSFIDSTKAPMLPYVPPSSSETSIKMESGALNSLILDWPHPNIDLPAINSCKTVTLVMEHNFLSETTYRPCARALNACESFYYFNYGGGPELLKSKINDEWVIPEYIVMSSFDRGDGDSGVLANYVQSIKTFDVCPGQRTIVNQGLYICYRSSWSGINCGQDRGKAIIHLKVH